MLTDFNHWALIQLWNNSKISIFFDLKGTVKEK